MSKTVGVREVKARFSHYMDVARTEGDVIITDRGRPVARLSGIHRLSRRSLDDVLNELAESGWIDLGSPPATERGAVKPRAGHSVSKTVRDAKVIVYFDTSALVALYVEDRYPRDLCE